MVVVEEEGEGEEDEEGKAKIEGGGTSKPRALRRSKRASLTERATMESIPAESRCSPIT